MPRFGQRFGGRTIPILRPDELSGGIVTGIWNAAESWLFDDDFRAVYDRRMRVLYDHFGFPTDTIPYRGYDCRTAMKHHFFEAPDWIRQYEFVEIAPHLYQLSYFDEQYKSTGQNAYVRRQLLQSMQRTLDAVLQREGSPYRFVNGELALVTSELEIAEIERAVAQNDKYAAARTHLVEALGHFAQRPPNFADSIKQAVSALESALEISTSVRSGDLTAQLRAFKNSYGLHGALSGAVEKLYGFASDEAGVRHGAGAPVTVGEPEARFILVTCSALLNFLILEASKPR